METLESSVIFAVRVRSPKWGQAKRTEKRDLDFKKGSALMLIGAGRQQQHQS